jgi:hypothetical protein
MINSTKGQSMAGQFLLGSGVICLAIVVGAQCLTAHP